MGYLWVIIYACNCLQTQHTHPWCCCTLSEKLKVANVTPPVKWVTHFTGGVTTTLATFNFWGSFNSAILSQFLTSTETFKSSQNGAYDFVSHFNLAWLRWYTIHTCITIKALIITCFYLRFVTEIIQTNATYCSRCASFLC